MYVVIGLIGIWVAGLLFFVGQTLNDIRVALNNLAPDARYSDYSYVDFTGFRLKLVSKINPAWLTDVGRQHQAKAIRHERIMFAWIIGGLIFLACFFSLAPREWYEQ